MSHFWNRLVKRPARRSRRGTRQSSVRRRPRAEALETRQLLAANIFHNAAMPEDVNEDGQVSAIDALSIINAMNEVEAQGGPGGQTGEGDENRGRRRMTDVNNDGRSSAVDALMVINRLNRGPGGGDQTDQRPDASPDIAVERTGDIVLDWNHLFGEILVSDTEGQNPGYASRSMALLNTAIYDAVALAGDGDAFFDYSDAVNVDGQVDSRVAASQAAATILSELYPQQSESVDALMRSIMRDQPRGEATAASLELGNAIATEILALRADDGYDVDVEHTYGDEPGSFQPDPLNPDVPAWGPSWGEVDPFAIASAQEFVPESPPDLTSEDYADSYNEVKALGGVDSEVRTAEQTEIGIFWAYDREGLGTPMALFNDILATISQNEGNTFEENAALFASASVAMADAAVVAWTTKFGEDFWRPITAIRQGDTDGNPLTEADPDWTSLGAPRDIEEFSGDGDIVGFTPQFPTYISGHATFGGALFGAIREFYGTDEIAFDVTSRELEVLLDNPELEAAYGLDLDDATRSFETLTEAMAENGRSRVYLGIHFDFDDTVAQEVGQSIAGAVADQFPVTSVSDELDRPDRPRGERGPQDEATPRERRERMERLAAVDAALSADDLL